MRVIVNAAAANVGGAARHLDGFVRAAAEHATEHEWRVLVDPRALPGGSGGNVHLASHALGPGLAARLRWHERTVPRLAREWHADVVLSLLNFGPSRPPVPQVVLQRNALYWCPEHLASLGWRGRLDTGARRAMAVRTMRASAVVVAPTRAMRDLILARHPTMGAERLRVVPHGFDADAFAKDVEDLPVAASDRLRRPDAGVRVLFASHPAAHKGVEVLIEAARHLAAGPGGPFTFYLTMGPRDWPDGMARYAALAREAGVEDRVVFLGRIPPRAMPAVYAAVDVFLYPSLCESFGYPMVEAMSLGLPTVASDTPVNREMLGEAARYYPGRDAEAAAGAIRAVAVDEPLRRAMRDAARTRTAGFSWRSSMRDLVATIEEAVRR